MKVKPMGLFLRFLYAYLLLSFLFIWPQQILAQKAPQINCPRIISQSPYITHTLEWMGLTDCIIGVSRYDHLKLPHTGGILDPDALQIARLKPDLMFNSDWIEEDQWQLNAPDNAKAIRLHGFQSMQQVENNIRVIAQSVKFDNPDDKAKEFARLWREKAQRVQGNGKRILLLSSCNNTPYSFGPDTWLFDLFSVAGFKVVETHTRLRFVTSGLDVETLTDLAERLKPELVIIFQPKSSDRCQIIAPKFPLKTISLNGKNFFHPAPVLLDGLDELIAKKHNWFPQI